MKKLLLSLVLLCTVTQTHTMMRQGLSSISKTCGVFQQIRLAHWHKNLIINSNLAREQTRKVFMKSIKNNVGYGNKSKKIIDVQKARLYSMKMKKERDECADDIIPFMGKEKSARLDALLFRVKERDPYLDSISFTGKEKNSFTDIFFPNTKNATIRKLKFGTACGLFVTTLISVPLAIVGGILIAVDKVDEVMRKKISIESCDFNNQFLN